MATGGPSLPNPPGLGPGAEAPWARLAREARSGLSLARTRNALDGRDPPVGPDPDGAAYRAAVLVALFEESGETRVVLTKRSASLRSHTGQVAFPGGRVDAGESPLEAALREASEEVGLEPGGVEVVGELSGLSTVSSGSSVTPYVGLLEGRPQLWANPAEVDRVFDVSLEELLSEGVYRQELWATEGGEFVAVHFFDVDGEVVWGATAQILFELLQLVTAGQ